ncbi:MAG: hypothetical protein PUC65_13520 [Clostridiales bacterium]|nr:hypothetical protein [Clostridiales bacterium]
MKKARKKNQGFTFLEVVLSVAMVSLIFISLSNYFSSSIKTNAMSRRVQRATLANQTVLEEIRGTDYLADIAKIYANVDTDRIELTAVSSGGFTQATTPSWDGSELANNDCYYFLRTIQIDNVPYKVLIKIDDVNYKNTIVEEGITLPYNELEIPQVNEINGDKDAVIVDALQYYKENGDGAVLLEQEYKRVYEENGGSMSGMPEPATQNFNNGIERKLKIEINQVDATNLKVVAYLHFWNDTIPELHKDLNLDNTNLDLKIYDSVKLNADFNNMYIFFCPEVFDVDAQMEIRNNASKKLNLYTVYQNDLTPPTTYNLKLTGSNIDTSRFTYYSNVPVKVFNTYVPKNELITKTKKKRFFDVTVQAFLGQCELDDLKAENVIAEMKTTRGE